MPPPPPLLPCVPQDDPMLSEPHLEGQEEAGSQRGKLADRRSLHERCSDGTPGCSLHGRLPLEGRLQRSEAMQQAIEQQQEQEQVAEDPEPAGLSHNADTSSLLIAFQREHPRDEQEVRSDAGMKAVMARLRAQARLN